MIAVGSTLTVEPAASLCAVAADAGASLVVVNRDPTPYDALATEVIREPIGVALPRITDDLLSSVTRSG
jgi:NAD-dependent deacetylase